MITQEFALFDTAVGRCAIVWSGGGIAGVQFPEANDERTRARLRRRHPEIVEAAPPPDVARACEAIAAVTCGAADDLAEVMLDMGGVPDFERQVYESARTVRPGATTTYGDIARRLGTPEAAREVGQALGRNPFVIVVPCHRVLAAGGKIGGFSAPRRHRHQAAAAGD